MLRPEFFRRIGHLYFTSKRDMIILRKDVDGINLREIAEQAGVSTASVSLVLNGKAGVSTSLRERLSHILTQEGYSVKPFHSEQSAGGTAVGTKRKIQLIKYKRNGYFVERNGDYINKVIDGAENAAREHGYSIGIVNADQDNLEQIFEQLNGDPELAGVLFLGPEFYASESAKLEMLRCPIVIVDARLEDKSFDSVSIDEQMGVGSAIRHLYDLGHRRILYLSSAIKGEECLARDRAFDMAVRQLQLTRADITYLEALPDADDSYRVMMQALEKPLQATAVFASNDMMAIGVLRALNEKNLRVPEDVSLVGVDDLSISSALTPPLTTVAIGKYEIGYLSVTRLMEKQKKETPFGIKTLVGTQLMVRQSTGPAKTK